MKRYQTTDGYTITKNGRAKRLYYNDYGRAYFMWNGRREYIDNVMRLSYPVMYDDNGKIGVIGGYITITNCFGVLVEVDENCESVQLWNENRD